jgi:2-oxoglutarate ferredoxin oxidoreductase subunit alpha
MTRAEGRKISQLRLISVFPFPERAVREFANGLDRIIVPELNLGQICHVVKEALEGKAAVELVSRIGGEIIPPEEIVKALVEGGEGI